MSVLALHHHPDEGEMRRYSAAAIAIVLLHVALIAAALLWYERPKSEGVSLQPILVDLPPADAAAQISPDNIEHGPVMEQAEMPRPTPQKEETVEQLPPTPLQQEEAAVVAPPKVEPRPPEPAKPQEVVKDVPKPTKKPPAPRTTAPRNADRVAREQSAPASAASSATAAAAYRAILMAHLQRFKRSPSSSPNKEDVVATVAFTVTRDGRVVSNRLARPTGFAPLDQEALALMQRAQPLPRFLPEMREASIPYTLPYRFQAGR